ncbi:MAG: hypothetical protein U0412_07290 [Nitrospira sp.]
MIRACVISLSATLLIGGILYYALKRADVTQAHQLEAQVDQAAEQQAVAVSRSFASLSGAVLLADLSKMQELLSAGWSAEWLVDAMLIDTGNRVFAASNPAYVGQELLDPGWRATRAQNREVVYREEPVSNQVRFIVVEPVQGRGSTVAWARLSFMRAKSVMPVRSPEERLHQVARILGPVFLCLLGAVALAMRLTKRQMQVQIQSVVDEALTEQTRISEIEQAYRMDEIRRDGGTRTAA